MANGSGLLSRSVPEQTDSPPPLPSPAPSRHDPGPDLASRRVRRNRAIALLLLLALIAGLWLSLGRGRTGTAAPPPHPHPHHRAAITPKTNPRLDPDWEGDGKAVSMAFGGDVNFPSGSTLGDRLAADPATALGTGVPALLSGVDLSMVNLETALTDGTCPDPQPKTYDFYAPASAITALQSAGVSLVTEANNHGEDCGPAGLQMALSARAQSRYTILGIGQTAAEAFTPYQVTIDGEHIGIIAATQVIDDDLQDSMDGDRDPAGAGLRLRRERPGLGRGGGPQSRRHRRRLPPLGRRAGRLPRPAAGAAGQLRWSRPEPTSSSAATPTSCWAGGTSVRRTSTTDWATSPSTTPHPRPIRAGRW